MRKLFPILLVILLLVPASADPSGEVTISLQEYLKMLSGEDQARKLPPRPFTLSGAESRADISGDWLRVRTTCRLELTAPGWQEIPLLSTEAALSGTRLDGKPTPVYQKEGKYFLLTQGLGAHRLELDYQLPLGGKGQRRSTNFRTLDSPVSRLQLVLPGADYDLITNPPVPATARKNVVQIAFTGGADRSTMLSWSPRRKANSANRTARLRAEVKTKVTISERTARCTSTVDYNIRGGEVEILRLKLPQGTEVVEVACSGLAGWNVTEGQLNVALSRSAAEALTLKVVYESPIANINSTWELPSLNVLNVRSVKGWVAIGGSGNIEVTTADLSESRNVEPSQLPREICGDAVLAAVKYSSQPFRVTLETRKGEEVALLTASIDSGEVRTLVTGDGKVISNFVYQMRNNRKQYLELRLPKGQVIWSAFVAGKAVKPVETSEGLIKLPLISSLDGQPYPVELTCVSSRPRYRLMGTEKLRAPEVDVPISRLNWTVHLPGQREVFAFSGDLQPLQLAPEVIGNTEVSGDKTVAKDEDLSSEESELGDNLPASSAGQPAPAADRLMNIVTTTPQGNFPVRVRVPEVGRSYSFQKLMVTGEMPEIEFSFYQPELVRGLGWTLFFGLLVIGMLRFPGWKFPLILGGLWMVLHGIGSWNTPIHNAVGWAGLILLLIWWLTEVNREKAL